MAGLSLAARVEQAAARIEPGGGSKQRSGRQIGARGRQDSSSAVTRSRGGGWSLGSRGRARGGQRR
uniref:Uncharacterized protein n=1 Tax=Arundo donax TaxID=35708 RepID=A0A0A8ZVU7_ARUDO